MSTSHATHETKTSLRGQSIALTDNPTWNSRKHSKTKPNRYLGHDLEKTQKPKHEQKTTGTPALVHCQIYRAIK